VIEQNIRKPVIDFTNYIKERTTNFIGREWVFQAINDWLANPYRSRYFLLTREPGSWKKAIASRLSQFGQGSFPSLEDLTRLAPHFVSAMHFCSARDSRWINPHVFAESLAMQLAECYPAYSKALAEKSRDLQVCIEVQQRVEQGQAIGVIINQLDVSGIVPEDAYNRVVREPLEELFRDGFNRQVIILIDALDEPLSYSGNVNIAYLLSHINELPDGVRFILISRQEPRVENAFLDADILALSTAEFGHRNQEDIRQYVKGQLSNDIDLIKKAAQLSPEPIVEEVIETIVRKAEGNFLYVRFLLDAMASGLRSLTELEGVPNGLDELYFDSFQRLVKLGGRNWTSEYGPLIGVLSVAQESLTQVQLEVFRGQSELDIWGCLGDFQ
jgi:hypothetical protein